MSLLNMAGASRHRAALSVPAGANVLDDWDPNTLTGANASSVSALPPTTGAATLSQATSGQQPKMYTGSNGLDGNTILRFDGTDDSLTTTVTADAWPYTVYLLFKPTFIASVTREPLATDGLELYIDAPLTATTGTRGSWSYATNTFGVCTQGVWELWTIVSNGASSYVAINGTQIAVGAFSTAAFGPGVYVGRHAASRNFLNGDIARIIHCDVHNSTQVADMHTYFRTKYPSVGIA